MALDDWIEWFNPFEWRSIPVLDSLPFMGDNDGLVGKIFNLRNIALVIGAVAVAKYLGLVE